jgi:hypothetical protein
MVVIPDPDTGAEHDTILDMAVLANHNAGRQHRTGDRRVGADADSVKQNGVADPSVFADLDVPSEHRAATDDRACGDLTAGADD